LARHGSFRNTLEYAFVRALLAPLAWLPRDAAETIARVYAAVLDWMAPRLRQTAFRNLEMAMPALGLRERRQLVDGVFCSIARVLVGVARLPSVTQANVGTWIRYEGFEHFQHALGKGKGVLFATGHLGNWELSAYAHALMTAPMSFVVRPLDNPKLEALALRYRTGSGNRVIGRDNYVRPILQALKRNEAVGILVDQNMTADRGVFVDFFGRKACVESGLAKIAAKTGAAVIPGFAVWSETEGRYILRFYPPVEISGDEVDDTQRVQAALEAAIRERPDQWLWIHRRWKTRPEGEAPLYP
jgi:KDO2-lipid IV(A) lauroyltransferase